MSIQRRLRKERTATHAHLSRLNEPSDYLATLRLLIWLPIIDLGLHGVLFTAFLSSFLYYLFPFAGYKNGLALVFFVLTGSTLVSYIVFYWPASLAEQALDVALTQTEDEDKANVFGLLSLILSFRFLFTIGTALLVDSIPALMNHPLRGLDRVWFPALISYIGIWAPSALFLARRSRLMSPLFWPLFPFFTIVKSAKALVVVVASLLKNSKAVWREIGPRLPALLVLLLFCAACLRAPKLALPPFAMAFIGGVSYLAYRIFLRCKDMLRWRRWKKRKSTQISTHEFIESVRSFRTEKYRVRFINAVRTESLINDSASAKNTIYDFVRELETPQPSKPRDSVWRRLTGNVAVRLYRLLNPRGRLQPRSRDYLYGVIVLDEVLKLLEQVQATR